MLRALARLTDRRRRAVLVLSVVVLFAAGAYGGPVERVADLRVGAVHAGEEQLLLGAEEPEQVGLGDAGLARDRLGRGAVQAPDREVADRDLEDLLAALLGGLAGAGLGCRHGHVG